MPQNRESRPGEYVRTVSGRARLVIDDFCSLPRRARPDTVLTEYPRSVLQRDLLNDPDVNSSRTIRSAIQSGAAFRTRCFQSGIVPREIGIRRTHRKSLLARALLSLPLPPALSPSLSLPLSLSHSLSLGPPLSRRRKSSSRCPSCPEAPHSLIGAHEPEIAGICCRRSVSHPGEFST